jgi:ATP-dependent metalloprotease FtsH
MFQNLNNPKKIDNNLKLMSISAIVLIVLFVYIIIKSDNAMSGSSYYVGIGFLFILMGISFFLQKYKLKIREIIPENKFQKELNISSEKYREDVVFTKIKAVKSSITFKDVAGIESIKEELEEVVDFLNNPKKYTKYDVSLPKGVLLVGPPGVGKTLIARAVAGEANVPFFYQSGASFVHIYVGMGAKRVKELFQLAKVQAPSIIFIDEIDAVGKQRGLGSNDEREATLNELLTQMDGFDENNGVIVIAATNKIDLLDEALLRAGRFDRRVFIDLPSKEDRKKILELYLKNKQIKYKLNKLVADTSGFTSSALATLVNEALLNMIKRNGTILLEDDIEYAKKKIQFGKKQLNILDKEQKNILATYQASKAFISKVQVQLLDEGLNKPIFIYPSKSQLKSQIANNLAGSVGIEILLKEPYVVFESELKEAKKLANLMVDKYDMGHCSNEILNGIKDQLKITIEKNKENILILKTILLEDEIVVF